MTLRDEYEYLKSELMVELADATVMCNLDFPFDFKISKEEEDRYFIRGVQTRLATKKSMIILDNTYKKCRLFPSEETVKTFIEARDGILEDYKKDVMTAFNSELWRYRDDDEKSYFEYISNLAERIKEASNKYVEILRNLKPEDIEKEIKAKDKLKKTENTNFLQNAAKNTKGLF
ncbi:TPA: hypothetical protein IAA92_05210 [Candidatus Galligastranaerophilus intestinigallinarum]|nr:hypothetical protein [Candidatus Galligastranaerophilus intestinigallinarum]